MTLGTVSPMGSTGKCLSQALRSSSSKQGCRGDFKGAFREERQNSDPMVAPCTASTGAKSA